MNSIFILLLVCIVSVSTKDLKTLSAPKIIQLNATASPPEVSLRWKTVTSSDVTDPVVAYTVFYWKAVGKEKVTQKTINGELVNLVEFVYPELNPTKDSLEESESLQSNTTELTISPIDYDTVYVFMVRAFTKKGNGPLSDPIKYIQPKD